MLTICCCCFGLEVMPQCEDIRFVAFALDSKWCPPMLRCTIWNRCFGLQGAPMLRCTILLPLLWFRSGALMLRCTICCHCFGFEVVPHCYYLRFVAVALASKPCPNSKMYWFVAVALVSKWCPNARMCDLLPLLWSRSGAPIRRYTICCRCCGLEVVPQCWDVRFVAIALAPIGAPMLKCTICCCHFGLEVVLQC